MTKPAPILEPFRTKAWPDEARRVIHTLRENAPRSGVILRPQGWPVYRKGCASATSLDLVQRRFHFVANKGAGGHVDKIVTVHLQRIVMIAFLHAMIEAPSIVVGFGDATYATYRSNAQQRSLYDNYLHGGPLAAKPCTSFHELGRSIDGYYWTDQERAAMRLHGFYDLLPQDPPHMTFGVRG